MTETISARQLGLLQYISKNPGAPKAQLPAALGATDEDLAYLVKHDMIREREADCFRIAHFGEMVLRRSL